MAKRVITISREFGSGGRAVGKRVAERLGVAYYDRELIARIAEKSGLAPAYIAEYGEYATSTSSFLHNLDIHAAFAADPLSVPDQLYVMQHNTIRELADAEPCVIVGRCSDYALQDRDDCLHVFLHADQSFRTDRIVRLYGETAADPVKLLEETDGKRKVYYEHYTNRSWGMAKNYHVSLNSGAIGLEKCADIVCELAESP